MLSKPERWVCLSGMGFLCACGLCYWMGEHDAERAFYSLPPTRPLMTIAFNHARAREVHTVSWLYLLLPIILTTAFVIFGAWRRAVRDTEVAAVGGDES